MKKVSLLVVFASLLTFVNVSAQNKEYQVQFQKHITTQSNRTVDQKQTTNVNEGFTEETWNITPLSDDQYEVTLIKNQDYFRVKNEGKKWRTTKVDYSFLPNPSHPLLNIPLRLTLLKDTFELQPIDAGKKTSKKENYAMHAATSYLYPYLAGNKSVKEESFTLSKKNKDGSRVYTPVNTDNLRYTPSSNLSLGSKGNLGYDFQRFIESDNTFNRMEYDRSTKDSVSAEYVVHSQLKEVVKTIEIDHTPYTVIYRDENFVQHDSTYTKTNATLRGKITGFDPNSHISIDFTENLPGSYKRKAFVFYADKKGNFEFKMYLDEPMEFDFWHHEKTKFVLVPGDDLYLTLDMSAFDETVKWTGRGSEKNQFLADLFLFEETNKLSTRDYYNSTSEAMATRQPDEFKALCDSLMKVKVDFLNQYIASLPPSEYLKYYGEEILTNFSRKSDFPRSQSYYRKQANKEPLTIDDDLYFDFRDDFHADNDLLSFATGYEHNIREITFFNLYSHLRNEYQVPFISLDDNYKKRVSYIELFHTGLSAYYLKYITLGDVIQRASWPVAEEMMADYKEDYPNSPLLQTISKVYAKAQTVAPGQMAYDFELEDLEGNPVHLSDYRGKVVYIDFWSTGCGPCRYQIENYSEKLHKEMEDKDIVFMYIACQGNTDGVKKYMDKNNVTGVKLIAKDKEATIRDKYWFNGIPRYYIIGRDGKIVDREARRPSELLRNPQILLDALEADPESAHL